MNRDSIAAKHADVAIVGAGIVGLAHALAAAKRGHRVAVFDRHPQVIGASIRNFGMIWPIGQPAGALYERALRSRHIWKELAGQAGFALTPSGSLHLAYRHDELAVLQEFADEASRSDRPVKLLTADEVAAKSPAVITDGLLAALWSPLEMVVDPREAIRTLPELLSAQYGVEFCWSHTVTAIAHPYLIVNGQSWTADQIWVCSGADFETLYPHLYAESGLIKVKLQMMRTGPQPQNWRLGPSLCGGLTLTHYEAFANCPSLSILKARIARETPHFPRWGIHVMMSQNALGELIIGDSHEYGLNPDPFDQQLLNNYILNYLKTFANVSDGAIAATWHGVYAKRPGYTEWVVHPEPGVTVVNALSGAGMTLSFGLAEEWLAGGMHGQSD